jgi:zinc protease
MNKLFLKKVSLIGLLSLFGCSQFSDKRLVSETKPGLQDGIHQVDAKKLVLKNGLTLILVKNPKLPIFSIYTFYKVGSKHEYPGITGSAHFLEHMMFKGAKKYGKGSFDKVIEKSGGQSNAYTNYDLTGYYQNLPISSLDQILDLEADRMENVLLDPQDFSKEKEVVLEERKQRYENSPRGQLYIGMMNQLFQKTPYEVPVIGTIEDIKTVPRDDVYKFFKTYYAPNNATMVIAGDIDFSSTVDLVEKYFAKIPVSEKLPGELPATKFVSKFTKDKEEHYQGETENPLFTLAFPGFSYGTKEGYVADILSILLAGNKSSFLNQKYVQNSTPLFTSVSASNYTLNQAGVFFISGELIKSSAKKSLRSTLLNDFQNFCKTKITEKEVQKIKNQHMIQFYRELETNSGIANYLGVIESYLGDFTRYVDEIKTYQSITALEVKKSCEKILDQKNYYMTVWKNNTQKFKI